MLLESELNYVPSAKKNLSFYTAVEYLDLQVGPFYALLVSRYSNQKEGKNIATVERGRRLNTSFNCDVVQLETRSIALLYRQGI